MSIYLSENAYGKNAINLSKIIRHKDYHEFRQLSVNVSLKGDFDTAHTMGDNTKILATDTQKNTVYALAKEHFTGAAESFGIYLANFFTGKNPQVSQVTIDLTEHAWTRMITDGAVHPHAYISGGAEKRFATVIKHAAGTTVSSGVKELLILKTTDSGFENFIREPYTTLKETADRIFSTKCEASWLYENIEIDFDAQYHSIRDTLLKTFAFHQSLSVQQTLYAMGEAVLKENSQVREISLVMPNKHHILFNLEQFGMENKNEIFIATDEPYGYITGTLRRG
ncbi:MAG: factor-independent urate hydroxylase [Chitinophagaceae bacterium]